MFVINKVENDAINQQIGWYIGFLYKQLSFQGKCFDVTVMNKTFNSQNYLDIGGTILGITELFK